MPRVSKIEVLHKNEQPTLSIRTITSVDKLPMLIGESYGKMGAYLQAIGEHLSDVPFVAYHNMDMQNLDVEIGFPVAKALSGKDDIKSSSTPAGKVVFCMYRGDYSGCEPAYNEMAKWIEDNGFKPVGTAYEYYYNSPQDFPMDEMLTMIVMPIE